MLSNSSPALTGNYLKELIHNYYASRDVEPEQCCTFNNKPCKWLLALENFYYHHLTEKEDALSYEELFDLAKIIFLENHKLDTLASEAKYRLVPYYNTNVIAALYASGGPVHLLRNYFAVMCTSPNDAVNISFALISIENIKNEAKKLKIHNPIFTSHIQQEILQQPTLASDFVLIFQQLQRTQGAVLTPLGKVAYDKSVNFIRKDRMLYILTMLKSTNQLSLEFFNKIQGLSTEELMHKANEIKSSSLTKPAGFFSPAKKEPSEQVQTPSLVMRPS